ncbi:MAG: manganese efflux pump MntP family protein [Proteobacteria bacterium]|nr:manganese efflux pump MntP family protein [Pseudomonadota bacterium]
MTPITVLLISIGLAMDAFAVSIGLGIKAKENKLRIALKTAFMFGVFQSLMPVIGWLLGNQFKDIIVSYDHWVAFFILVLIGAKMIYESTKIDKKCPATDNADRFITLFMLAIATSIDALAVGISFSFLDILITIPVIVIGCVTFIFSFIGVEIGNRLGCHAKSKAEVLGGLILIILGIKILLEHTYFA